jgi:phage portal protein BeeE
LSDVQAIATAIDTDYQASKWSWKFFYNNASVDGVLETDQDLSPEKVDIIQNKWDQKYR